MANTAQKITELLRESSEGNAEAMKILWPQVYAELKRLARNYMAKERSGHTLQATALVHEAFMKLFEGKPVNFQDRGHFFAVAAQAMRQIMVDHAKAKRAKKRGGGDIKIAFDEKIHSSDAVDSQPDILALDRALAQLGKTEPRLVQVVELRYFGGLSLEETAETLNISTATVKRSWAAAKIWLYRELSSQEET